MATSVRRVRNGWWALLFAYSLTGLSLCTFNRDWLSVTRDLTPGILETARGAAPTELAREKIRRHLTQQTQRKALFIERLLHEDLSTEDPPAGHRTAVVLVLVAASERWK